MRQKILLKIADFTSKSPWWMLLILTGITVLFALMAENLTLSPNFTNLMPQDDPMVQEFDRIMDEYAGSASMMVVAEGDPQQLVAFADYVAPQIAAQKKFVKKVDYKLPLDYFNNHALMLMKSSDLKNTGDLFTDPNLTGFLTNLNNSFEKEYIQSDEKISGQEQEQGVLRFMDGIQTFTEVTNRVLDGETKGAGEEAAEAVLVGDIFYRSWDREMLIMQVIPIFSWTDTDLDVEATNTIEKIVHDAAEKYGIHAGLTGTIPLARDEFTSIMNDSMTFTTIAVVGIFILFMVAFRMIVSPFLAVISLIIGIVWAMGLAWVLVGELNMMTSMMAVVLAGLGIDFSIHIISSFTEMRLRGEDMTATLRYTLATTGQGILIGGLTTAAAFLTMLISSNAGMKEFGLTLGMGILMTMVASMLTLPTFLVIRERLIERFWKREAKKRDVSYRSLGTIAVRLSQRWGLGLAMAIAITLFMGYRSSRITMDYNYLNMEPVGLESIKLQDRMIDKLDLSSDYAFVTATNLEEADKLTKKAKKMSTSGMVRSIVDFLPPKAEQMKRTGKINEIRKKMEQAPVHSGLSAQDVDQLIEEIGRLEMNIMEVQDMGVLGGQDKVYLKTGLLVGVVPEEEDSSIIALQETLRQKMASITEGSLTHLRERMGSLKKEEIESLNKYQSQFAGFFKSRVLSMANPEPLSIETLPESIRNQFVGTTGDNFLITIFPKSNVWDLEFLARFSDELEILSPRATGLPPVFRRLMNYIADDGRKSSLLAVILIFLILMVDFKSWRRALIAIFPLIIGMVWMVGTMELVGYQLTMLNIMALPLIIGIGIDDGVHIMHRYNVEGSREHRKVFSSTGRAILLTSLTTMIGFGSLRFATYRGMGSMGMALFIGVGTCFLATVIIVPVLMGWRSSRSKTGT
ncbi:MAG: MMPL family transporter, partial [FCB group bacterium]|nr:MMPL family transporter [FCB group bacterium]